MRTEIMKSLTQYLTESEKSYDFRLRSIVELTDQQLDKLETFLEKYNVVSVKAPRKTIMQRAPRGFGDTGPAEVHMIDFTTKLPVSTAVLHEEISRKLTCGLGSIRVHSVLEDQEVWDDEYEAEDNTGKSVLADEKFGDTEKVDHSDNFGNEFVDKFIKNLPKTELSKEYKV